MALNQLPFIEQIQAFVHRINVLVRLYQIAALTLFEPFDDIVEQVAQKCLRKIVQKQRIDFQTSPHQDLQVINLDSLQHEEVKEIGAGWLGIKD